MGLGLENLTVLICWQETRLFCNFANESSIPAFQNTLCPATNCKHILIKQQPQMTGLSRGFTLGGKESK